MRNLYELIESIRVTLASSSDPDRTELTELHREVTDEIRQANKRLRECDALLANGHRSEAIQLAEQEPELLEVVSILDFPELPEWNDFVAEMGLNVAPELEIDIAAELNHAYSEQAPLEQLLRRFRVLSLARAPLRDRIELIRKIAKVDEGNSVWINDLQDYEKARLNEIKEQFRAAHRENDLRTLMELADEVTQGPWRIKPNQQFVDRIEQAAQSLRTGFAVERMRRVAERMRTAREENDFERASELLTEWDRLHEICDEDSAELSEVEQGASKLVRWARKELVLRGAEQEYDKKLERLRRALSAGRMDEISHRYTAVANDDNFELPDDLEEQYAAAVTWHRRKQMIILGVGGVVLVVLLVYLGMVIVKFSPRDESRRPTADMNFAAATGDRPVQHPSAETPR